MATKSSKTTDKSLISERPIVKELRPSDIGDLKHMGYEPLFVIQPDPDRRKVALAVSFNWYSRFYGTKQAKEILIQYLDYNGRKDESKQFQRLDEKDVITTYSWLARLSMRGLELTEIEISRIDSEIERLKMCLVKPEDITKVVGEKPTPTRPNIQEIMREKAKEAQGELEGLFDEFIGADLKLKTDGKVMGELSERNVLPQHISMLVEVWQKKISEFTELLNSDDKQLKEAYSHYSKTQIKQIIKFCEAIIADMNGYSSVKKSSSKPRTRKAVPVEKIVAKLKFLKKFEDTASKLKLESISPTKLHNCSEAFLYDTTKRKLIYLIADDYSKTLTIKGNTILGFDSVKSQVKTIRKPTLLNDLMKVGKPASRKFFDDLTTVGTTPTGRMNEGIVILKAW
jgi:hypothetical protein